jgi:hypothetical protein
MQEKVDGNILDQVTTIITRIQNDSQKNPVTNEHLLHIKSLLKQSIVSEGDEINIAKIYEAIHFIETIPIKVQRYSLFFKKTEEVVTMADLMSKKGEIILLEQERRQLPISLKSAANVVPAKTEEQFSSIHHDLVELISDRYQYLKDAQKREALQKKPKVAWDYDYPVDEVIKEVMNHAIGEWQNQYTEMNSDRTKAYGDYKRDVSIRGITAKSDKEVEDLLEYLMMDTDYSARDNPLIKQWLQANGGQDMNRFLDTLLYQGEFTSHEESSLLNTMGIEQRWSVENAKVVFSYESVVYTINMDGNIWANDERGNLKIKDDPETIKDKSGKYHVPPLMRVKSKIELNVNEKGAVVPSITALNVQSYSAGLIKPDAMLLKKNTFTG